MPLEADMDELLVKSTDYERLSEMFREFEFTTLLNKLKKSSWQRTARQGPAGT